MYVTDKSVAWKNMTGGVESGGSVAKVAGACHELCDVANRIAAVLLSQDFLMQRIQKKVAWCERELNRLECSILQVLYFFSKFQHGGPLTFFFMTG